jgi:hypothetical protein
VSRPVNHFRKNASSSGFGNIFVVFYFPSLVGIYPSSVANGVNANITDVSGDWYSEGMCIRF